jgi:CheY-like chemotaxis protein
LSSYVISDRRCLICCLYALEHSSQHRRNRLLAASDGSIGTMPAKRQEQTTRPIGISLGELPLAGKSVLIIEDEALIALNVESCLQDAGAAVVIANSIVSAQSALDEGTPFDVAVVDFLLADGNASTLIQVLSERGIPVVVTTGDEVDRGQPALSKAVAILQKPHTESDLINAITKTPPP